MNTQDPAIFALLNEIGIIEQLARNRFERAQPDGLRLPQFSVLNHLVRVGEGRSPGQIARAFEVNKATMTNTLQRLEERGLIRLEDDASDGRAKRVFLTEEGRARRDAAVRFTAENLAPLVTELGDTPEALLPGLRALRGLLDRSRDGL